MLHAADPGLQKHGLRAQRVRPVLWYRDPLELIVSATNYHQVAREKWLDAKGTGLHVHQIFYACGKSVEWLWEQAHRQVELDKFAIYASTWSSGADQDLCEDIEKLRAGRSLSEMSYRDLVLHTHMSVSVRVEAIHSYLNLKLMSESYVAFSQDKDVLAVDMDDAMQSYNETFRKIFTFWGAADVESCVDFATQFDVSLKQPIDDVSSVHVGGKRAAPNKATQHKVLLGSPWFKRSVQPFRIAMNITEELTEVYRDNSYERPKTTLRHSDD